MALTRLALRRPLTMLMLIIALVVMGYQAFTRMQLENFPRVDFPVVAIVVVYPGASPEDIEDQVVEPIEDAVATIAGIERIESTSREGVGQVVIEFVEGTEGDIAAVNVERQVSSVQLPDDAEDPLVVKADPNAQPILSLALSGPQSQFELFDLADQLLAARFQSIEGVASVAITGGREREVQVDVIPEKLAAFGVTLGEVQQALQNNNLTFPAGSVDVGRQAISVRSVGEFESVEQIENVIVREEGDADDIRAGRDTGGRVYLRDVATVHFGLKEVSTIARYNGRDAVTISVVKTSEGNTVEVAERARAEVANINETLLPPGAELVVVQDSSEFVEAAVNGVIEDLILAVIITGLVMLAFLHTIRSTFIVLLALPTSIISTFLVMWMLGFSLNQLTLLALTLVIGILVDDSIVVIENVERHLGMNKTPEQAAYDARDEIALAGVTITSVDVVVYLPVAFVSGILGQFFFPYGVTIAVAGVLSLFMSFTLTPMLAAAWMRDEHAPKPKPKGLRWVFSIIVFPLTWLGGLLARAWDWGFDLLARAYAGMLRFFLWNWFTQLMAISIAIAALIGGFYLVVGGFVGSEFLPQEDDGQIRIAIEMPPGTNLDTTDAVARQVEQMVLANVGDVTASILTLVGSTGGGLSVSTSASNEAIVNVQLIDLEDRDLSNIDVTDILRPVVQTIPEGIISLTLGEGGGPGGAAVEVQLFGPDINQLIELANETEALLRAIPGAVDIANTDAVRTPETRMVIDRDQANDLGISPALIGTTLRSALTGVDVGEYDPGGGETEVDITLRANEMSRDDLSLLLQTPVGFVNGQPVPLDRVVDVEQTLTPARITRSDRQRVLSVSSEAGGGRASGDVAADLEAGLAEQVNFPTGYGFRFAGATETQQESFAQMGQAILLAVLLIYMLLVALYQSWFQPLAIMFSLPVTLVGAFGGLYLTGFTLNLISLLGIVLLTGVVTKNAILVLDFTNSLREQGYERKEALINAGRLRLRAVLMTALTLILSLLPLLFSTGAGSANRAPMAAVVIGGMTSSTVLTLMLVPVVYNFFDQFGEFVGWLFHVLFGADEPTPEAEIDAEEVPEEEETGDEQPSEAPKDQRAPDQPRPAAPQPGSAISLDPDPDAA